MLLIKEIDFSEVMKDVTSDKMLGMSEYVVDKLTDYVLDQWRAKAQNNLKSSKNEYVRSLSREASPPGTGLVTLRNWLPYSIEQGAPPFDMKEGFRNSEWKKTTKKGTWFLDIPRRFATPGAVGEAASFSGRLPKDVYRKIKGAVYLSPKYHGEKTIRKEISVGGKVLYPQYISRSSRFAGLQPRGSKEGRVHYMTFRRVSEKSDPLSWIHPGFTPHRFAEGVVEDQEFEKAFNYFSQEYLNSVI